MYIKAKVNPVIYTILIEESGQPNHRREDNIKLLMLRLLECEVY